MAGASCSRAILPTAHCGARVHENAVWVSPILIGVGVGIGVGIGIAIEIDIDPDFDSSTDLDGLIEFAICRTRLGVFHLRLRA